MSEMFLQNLARGLGSFGNTMGGMIRNTINTAGPQNVINMNALAGSSAGGSAGYQAGPTSANQIPNSPRTLDDVQNQFDYGPSVVRHPGYSGYDITQMMIGQDPEFMSRIYYGQEADRLAGGGTENTLAAMQYIKERNEAREAERFAKYGNPEPGSKFANPNLRNQQPTYVDRQDYSQPQMTDVDIFGSLF